MEIIDAQVHAWDVDNAEFPWDPAFDRTRRSGSDHPDAKPITAERMVGMMDAVGVSAAILASPTIYGIDHSYAFAAAARYPGRFGVVGPLVPGMPDLEERLQRFRDDPAGVGARIVVSPDSELLETDGCRQIFAAAEKLGVPMFVWVTVGRLRAVGDIAHAYPSLRLVVDHLGMRALSPEVDRLAKLPDLLALAKFDNVAVKASGTTSLSKERYPFADLWPHLHRVINAFGVERVMWGSDVTKHSERNTYCEGVDFIRRSNELSEQEKRWLFGGSLRRLLGWPWWPEHDARAAQDRAGATLA